MSYIITSFSETQDAPDKVRIPHVIPLYKPLLRKESQFLKHLNRYINHRESNTTANSQMRWARRLNSQCSKSPARCTWSQLPSLLQRYMATWWEQQPSIHSPTRLWKHFKMSFSQSWLGFIWSLESAENSGRKLQYSSLWLGKILQVMFSLLILLHLFTQLEDLKEHKWRTGKLHWERIRPIKWQESQHQQKQNQNKKEKRLVGIWTDTN